MAFSIDFVIQSGAAAGGFVLFFRGFAEYKRNNDIKRAEFLEKLIAAFSDEKFSFALKILDGHSIYFTGENGSWHSIQEGQGMDLETILRDHKTFPVTDPSEITLRYSFCDLLDFFAKLNYYLLNKLITPKEIAYFRYFIERVRDRPEVRKFIKTYYYPSDFTKLFEALHELKYNESSVTY